MSLSLLYSGKLTKALGKKKIRMLYIQEDHKEEMSEFNSAFYHNCVFRDQE